MATAAAKALSEAKVVADAQAKTKLYLGRIKAAVDDAANQCIEESHLDQGLVGHDKRTVGKVWARVKQIDDVICDLFFGPKLQRTLNMCCGLDVFLRFRNNSSGAVAHPRGWCERISMIPSIMPSPRLRLVKSQGNRLSYGVRCR